jgi:hypothetical protein
LRYLVQAEHFRSRATARGLRIVEIKFHVADK